MNKYQAQDNVPDLALQYHIFFLLMLYKIDILTILNLTVHQYVLNFH